MHEKPIGTIPPKHNDSSSAPSGARVTKRRQLPKITPKGRVSTILICIAILAWGIGSFYLASFLIGLLAAFLPFVSNTPLWQAVLSALVYVLGLALAVFIPGKLKPEWKSTRTSLGLDGLPTWLDIALAIAAYIVFALFAYLLNYIFASLFSWYDPNQAQDVGFNNLLSTSDRIIAFIALVVVAPVAEEILFRGWIYGKIRKYLPVVPAILLVSVAFGGMHGQWNAGLTTFVLAIVLCTQREITGTIYSGILLHMLNNALAFMAIFA